MAQADRDIELEPPTDAERLKALDQFRDLFGADTTEKDWQGFFDSNPFVLTETLPLKLTRLLRQVPLDSGEPDYIFCRESPTGISGDYGVIELKRPDHPVLGSYSSKIIAPSKYVRVALQQVQQYLRSIQDGRFLSSNDFIAAGNRRYAFIIVGNSEEITRKCKNELLLNQFRNLLPQGFLLFTYDELLDLFAATVPPIVQVLTAEGVKSGIPENVGRFEIGWRNGLHARPAVRFAQIAKEFRCEVRVSTSDTGEAVDGKNILSLMSLGAEYGEELTVRARGADAELVVKTLGDLITGTSRWNRHRFCHLRRLSPPLATCC